MVGTCSGTAPRARSRSQTSSACSFVLGTSTRQPNSGLVSNHDSAACAVTPSPTTATAGPCAVSRLTPAAFRSAAIEPSVPTTVCCSVVVPFQVMANGALSAPPLATSILPRSTGPVSAPRMTSVPSLTDTRLTSLALMIRTSPVTSLVSGMPAYSGTAVAADTPGTTSNGTRAFAQAAASAAPLQNMNG